MGEIVEFPSNGTTGQGYLALPEGGDGPGVVVIQEWWGLVDHIKDVCDRFAAEGFVALAPDLYHGEKTTEPDEAGKLMMSLNIETAAKDMSGAVDYVRDRSTGSGVGVVGFCMGGALALLVAAQRPDAVKAVAPFYGVLVWPAVQPDYTNLAAAVQGHFAENDDFANAEAVGALEQELRDKGKEVEVFTYPGTEHAFFNDARPEVHNAEASKQAWERTIAFLRSRLA
ncbi:MAG TPA: dienelactone hydrolase family protein [Acidimicrobiales bacterium]|jgi:carboxymethylenebutenolidase|nr:dienelactone hydrolase family protein [Acidimicrobiales bacterium]